MQPEEMYNGLLGDDYDVIKAKICYENAISAIKEYTNKDNIEELFPYPLVQLAYYFYKGFNDINIQSKSQGGRSNTLLHNIPNEIKSMLPKFKTVRIL